MAQQDIQAMMQHLQALMASTPSQPRVMGTNVPAKTESGGSSEAIAADLELTSPTKLGPDAPRSETRTIVSRAARMGDVTLDGVTL